MKYLNLIILFLICNFMFGQSSIQPIGYEELFDVIDQKKKDKPLIVNFWATWCVPCVEEMPYFEEVAKNEAYELLMVSLDFTHMLEKKLVPFLENHSLRENVVVLDQKHQNVWIERFDAGWSGAIPATFVFEGNSKLFHEGKFESFDDLMNFLKTQ